MKQSIRDKLESLVGRLDELDRMLARAAEQQESSLAARIALVVSLFEPAMLVLMGGVVLLALLCVQAVAHQQFGNATPPAPLPAALRHGVMACLALVFLQAALGG